MVPGIKIGCTVHALAHRVIESKWSKQRYGLAWKTKELRGTVTSMIGTGRSRKWNCHFEELSISRALSARSLIISGQDTLPPQQLTPASVNEHTRVQPCYRAMILWDSNIEEEKRSPGLFQTFISYANDG